MSDPAATSELTNRAIEVLKRVAAGEMLPVFITYIDDNKLTSITLNMSEVQLIAELSSALFDVQTARVGRKS